MCFGELSAQTDAAWCCWPPWWSSAARYSWVRRVRPRSSSTPMLRVLRTRRARLTTESETPAWCAMSCRDAVTPRPVVESANRAWAVATAIRRSMPMLWAVSAAWPVVVWVMWWRSWRSHSVRPDHTGMVASRPGVVGRVKDRPRCPVSRLYSCSLLMAWVAAWTEASQVSTSADCGMCVPPWTDDRMLVGETGCVGADSAHALVSDVPVTGKSLRGMQYERRKRVTSDTHPQRM